MARAAGIAWKLLAVAGIVGYPVLVHLGLIGGGLDPARAALAGVPHAAPSMSTCCGFSAAPCVAEPNL